MKDFALCALNLVHQYIRPMNDDAYQGKIVNERLGNG